MYVIPFRNSLKMHLMLRSLSPVLEMSLKMRCLEPYSFKAPIVDEFLLGKNSHFIYIFEVLEVSFTKKMYFESETF